MNINEIFKNVNSELLTEEVKGNIQTLIETKIKEKEIELEDLAEEFVEKQIAEKTDLLESAAVSYVEDHLINKIDDYFTYLSEKWFEKHSIEIDDGIKSEMYDKLVESIQTSLVKNSIPVKKPEIKNFVNESKELKEKVNELINENKSLRTQIKGSKVVSIFEKVSDGLSEIEKVKFKRLAEDLDVVDVKQFETKLNYIKENVILNEVEKEEPKKPSEKFNDTFEKVILFDKKNDVDYFDIASKIL